MSFADSPQVVAGVSNSRLFSVCHAGSDFLGFFSFLIGQLTVGDMGQASGPPGNVNNDKHIKNIASARDQVPKISVDVLWAKLQNVGCCIVEAFESPCRWIVVFLDIVVF